MCGQSSKSSKSVELNQRRCSSQYDSCSLWLQSVYKINKIQIWNSKLTEHSLDFLFKEPKRDREK